MLTRSGGELARFWPDTAVFAHLDETNSFVVDSSSTDLAIFCSFQADPAYLLNLQLNLLYLPVFNQVVSANFEHILQCFSSSTAEPSIICSAWADFAKDHDVQEKVQLVLLYFSLTKFPGWCKIQLLLYIFDALCLVNYVWETILWRQCALFFKHHGVMSKYLNIRMLD